MKSQPTFRFLPDIGQVLRHCIRRCRAQKPFQLPWVQMVDRWCRVGYFVDKFVGVRFPLLSQNSDAPNFLGTHLISGMWLISGINTLSKVHREYIERVADLIEN